MNTKPDFFLSAAGESRGDLSIPRACRAMGRLKGPNGDINMLIKIEPPVIGQVYGLGGRDITNLIISPRLQGYTLFPINKWPCPVYVARILDENIIKTLTFTGEQVEVIVWAMIFSTFEEANIKPK